MKTIALMLFSIAATIVGIPWLIAGTLDAGGQGLTLAVLFVLYLITFRIPSPHDRS